MSFFLRHNAPEGSFSKIDGSIEISTIQKHLGYSKEEILLATHPAFDHDSECLRKRRFIIIESYLPRGSKETRIAALGGHSLQIEASPGHFLLGKESASQLGPFTHRTSAASDIIDAGYLSHKGRKSSVNFTSGKNLYKSQASHEIEVDVETARVQGYAFFGNWFTNIIYGIGKWEQGQCSGKIPLKFLTIKKLH